MTTTRAYRSQGLLLLLIMTAVSIGVGVISITLLYLTAFDEEKERLEETARSNARLMEAVARFDRRYSNGAVEGGARAATLAQIRDAHSRFEGFGATGEFTLARRSGNRILFLLRHRHFDLDQPRPVEIDSGLAEPMKAALSGRSGTMIGVDYRGEKVLAAFEPVSGLDLGIVAKIDLDEVRAPYVRAALLSAGIGLTVMLLGAWLFLRIGSPLLDRLTASEQRYRGLFEQAADAVIVVSLDSGKILEFNTCAHKNLGYSREEFVALQIADLEEKENPEQVREHLAHIRAQGSDLFETRHRTKNGEVRDVLVSSKVMQIGKRQYLQSVFRDITEKKRSDEALRIRNRALEAIGSGILITDPSQPDNPVIYCNPAAEEMTGFSKQEILGRNPGMLYGADADPTSMQRVDATEAAKRSCRVELRSYRKNGTSYWCELSLFPVRNRHGALTHFIRVHTDISKRKRSEAALRHGEARYQRLFEDSPISIWEEDFSLVKALLDELRADGVVDLNEHLDGHPEVSAEAAARVRINDVNQATLDLHKAATKEELIASLERTFVPESYQAFRRELLAIWNGEDRVQLDGRVRTLEGELLDVNLRWQAPLEHSTTYSRVLVTLTDLTARKRAEDQLHASLQEKEVLLREVHHRVKNNMQVVYSLLSLQARQSADPKLTEALAESQQRVRTMALVHESLYRSQSVARIQAAEFIKALVGNLAMLYLSDPGRIRLSTDLEPVELTLDQAVPVGLIINELVSNAVKHGFPDGRGGTIEVSIARSDPDMVELGVRDDGVGMDPVTDPGASSTLGLQLVTAMSDQLGAQLKLASEQGTSIHIRFQSKSFD